MPLVRIALLKGTQPQFRRAIADSIHRSMVEVIGIPEQDRFQIITEHEPGDLIYDASYLGIARGDGVLLIQITLSAGRSVASLECDLARWDRLLKADLACHHHQAAEGGEQQRRTARRHRPPRVN